MRGLIVRRHGARGSLRPASWSGPKAPGSSSANEYRRSAAASSVQHLAARAAGGGGDPRRRIHDHRLDAPYPARDRLKNRVALGANRQPEGCILDVGGGMDLAAGG